MNRTPDHKDYGIKDRPVRIPAPKPIEKRRDSVNEKDTADIRRARDLPDPPPPKKQ